jgi:hypothetical protein
MTPPMPHGAAICIQRRGAGVAKTKWDKRQEMSEGSAGKHSGREAVKRDRSDKRVLASRYVRTLLLSRGEGGRAQGRVGSWES